MSMKAAVAKRPVLWFVIFTYGFSWILWALMILSARGLLPFRFPTGPAGSFGPAFGGTLTILLLDGWKGLRALLGSLVRVRARLGAYLYGLFLIVGIYFAAVSVWALTKGAWPAVKLELPAGKLVGYFFLILVLGGPLGEEVGWRGVLQPLLHRRLTPFAASAVIALIWFAWHIPLFWLEGAAQKGESILNFAVSTTAFAFLFTWLYLKSRGSLFLAILFHTSINFVSAVLVPALLAAWQKDASSVILLALFAAAAVLVVVLDRKEFFRRNDIDHAARSVPQ
jgi:membrane protease YdiL (CAAX protease family)